jgi:DNA-binding transcriptional MerR regulator
MSETYGIAALAREFDVTTRTIRFYEDKGLLSPARNGQRRIYASRDRVRLRLIMRGKRLGFSLDEIRQMIDLYDIDPTEVTQLRHFLDKIRQRKATLVLQQADIVETLEEMHRIESQCSALLSKITKE